MPKITVNNIQHKTGSNHGQIPTWLTFEMVGDHEIMESYNVTSITDQTIGETLVAFTNNMASGNYALGYYGRFNNADNDDNVPENGWKSNVALAPLSSSSHLFSGDTTNDFDCEWNGAKFIGDIA